MSKQLRASAIDSTLCERRRGLTIVIPAAKIGRGWEIPDTVWMFQGLFADIVHLSTTRFFYYKMIIFSEPQFS